MTNYAQRLTKEDLINRYGIAEVSEDGHIYRLVNDELKEIPQSIIDTNHGTKHYKTVQLYDRLNRVKVPRTKNGKETYNYKATGFTVHRVVAAWFYNEVPAGMVVDHINNDPFDNRLENLQIITQADNLLKERKIFREPMSCDMNKPLSWYEARLTQYLAKYEEAKESRDIELNHKYRAQVSIYKAKIAYWKLHEEEYHDYIRQKTAKQIASQRVVDRAQEIKRLKKLIDETREAYKADSSSDNKYGYEVAKNVYQNFLINNPFMTIAERTELILKELKENE